MDFLGEYLLQSEEDTLRILNFEELVPVFIQCKDMGSQSIGNKVVTFRYVRRHRVMDNITKLKGLSNWTYI